MQTIPAPQSASAIHGPPKQRPPAQIFTPPTSGRQVPESQAPQEDPSRHAGAVVVVLVVANVMVVVDVVVAVDAVLGVVVIVTGDSALTKAPTSASTSISIAAASRS